MKKQTIPAQQKILFLITKSNWGGAQRYVYNLATNLPPTMQPIVAVGGTGALIEKLRSHAISVRHIESFKRDVSIIKELQSLYELFRLIREERPDIVHVNSSKAGGLGACVARLLGVPRIIFTIHGWPGNEDRPLYQKRLISFFSWLTCMLSHISITITPNDFKYVRNLLFLKNKTAHIPNGIEYIDHQSKEAARTKLTHHTPVAIPQGALLVGTIAELTHNKDLSTMIESFIHEYADDDNTFLILIGGGELQHALQKQIDEHHAESRVLLLGAVPDAYTLLPAFDVFMLTSVKEGLPYVVLEAGSASLPVVATEVGGIPNIITHDYSGLLVPPRNIIETRKALRRLLDNPQERRILGHNLNTTVNTTFQLSRMVSGTLRAYTEKI